VAPWAETEPEPPPPWYRRLATPWGTPEVVTTRRPWSSRLATALGTPEVGCLDAAPARPRLAPALRVPLFRAVLLPAALGVFFSLVSLVAGVDLGDRLRSWLPHRTHVVQPGETLSSIAARYGITSWQELHGAGSNGLRFPSPDRIPAGARLDVPYRAAIVLKLELPGRSQICSPPVRALLHLLETLEPAWTVRLCDGARPPLGSSRV
jgi:hypothetical protein